ncbi:MAG: polysaccharide lyase family protein [Bryobacteraceae bacterium]
MSNRSVHLLWCCTLLAAASGRATGAPKDVVWRLGQFDHSSAEFRGQTGKNVAVDAGLRDAAAQWPAMQAGSKNARNQADAGPRTIRFKVTEAAHESYTLELAIMLGYPRIPSIELSLNGTPGMIYLNRKLSYHAAGRMDSPVCGEARERIPIPTGLIKTGENELRITAMDDAEDQNGDSWIEWDALQLVRGPASDGGKGLDIAVEPTPFYTQPDSGTNELIETTVSLQAPVRQGSITLALGGREYHRQLAAGRFGQQRFEFAVPEFGPGDAATVSLEIDGRKYNREVRLTPKRKFTVYVVPNTHLDIGFTDYQPKIEELQNRNLDKLLAEMRKDPDMRFSLDGAWLAEQFLRTRSDDARREFMTLVADGKIVIPAQSMSLMEGGARLETMLRSFLNGRALNREAGRTAEYANITDVPAYPWAYASALHAAGVKYFAAGANDDRGPQPLYGRWQTRSPFWWEGPDGGKVLMSYNRQYSNLWFVCGLPAREAGCRQSLPTFLQTFDSPSYQPDTVLMYGSQLENTDLIPGEGEFVRNWNARYAWPRLKLATFADYFHLIEQKYGDKLETVRGDFGPYWEDGIGTDSRFAAEYRNVESRALAVEKLSSLAALLSPGWAPASDRLRRMWNDLVQYAEHTYTYHGGYDQPEHEQSRRQIESKHFYVTDAGEQAHWIAQEGFSRLLDSISVGPPALAVFNALSHIRDGLVEFDLDNGLRLVDLDSRKTVQVETLRRGNGYRHVRFLAARVPAFGYRAYRMERGESEGTEAARTEEPRDIFENSFYRVKVDLTRGGVASIFDKQLGRELIDTKSPYAADQYVYVAGGEGSRIVHMRDYLPDARLTVGTSTGGKVTGVRKTNWGYILTYTTHGPHAPSIETEVRLFDAEKKIEFLNRIRKEPVNNKEAVYFAFPFAATSTEFEYEGQSGVVNPARDELAGGNREWYTAGHWIRVSGGGLSAAVMQLDTPLAAIGDINRGVWPKTFGPKAATIFSYPMNNYWHTNFPRVQEGAFTFRYVITSGQQLRPEDLSRMGREALTRLEVGQLDANDKVEPWEGSLPAGSAGFLKIDSDHVEIEALKPAADGDGYVLRFLETGGRPGQLHLASDLLRFERAWLSTASEEKGAEIEAVSGGLTVPVQPFGIVTVRVRMKVMPGQANVPPA